MTDILVWETEGGYQPHKPPGKEGKEHGMMGKSSPVPSKSPALPFHPSSFPQASPALGQPGLHGSCPPQTHNHRHSLWISIHFPIHIQEAGVYLIVCLLSLYSFFFFKSLPDIKCLKDYIQSIHSGGSKYVVNVGSKNTWGKKGSIYRQFRERILR